MDNNVATQPNPLLDKLIIKQGSLSDYKFAKHLRITRPLWQLTRTGKRPIGFTLIRAVTRATTEFDEDILNFLRTEDHAGETTE